MNASALAAITATDLGFIGLDVFSGVATKPILVGTKTASRWQSRGLAFVLVLLAIRLALTPRPH